MATAVELIRKGVDVKIQDQVSDIVDYYLCRDLFTLALSSDLTLDTYTVPVVDGSAVVDGTYICIQETKRAFQAQVLSGGGTNILTVDTPLDYPFTTAALIWNRSPDLNVNGSGTPIIARLNPIAGVKWDVTRIILNIKDDVAADDGLFGGIAALTKGIVIRKTDGIHHTIFNAKTNGDLRERAFDVAYSDRGSPATGVYGVSMRRSFSGQDKNGVAIRLDGDENDALEVLIQDNLTALVSFRIVAQGHVVEDVEY